MGVRIWVCAADVIRGRWGKRKLSTSCDVPFSIAFVCLRECWIEGAGASFVGENVGIQLELPNMA